MTTSTIGSVVERWCPHLASNTLSLIIQLIAILPFRTLWKLINVYVKIGISTDGISVFKDMENACFSISSKGLEFFINLIVIRNCVS